MVNIFFKLTAVYLMLWCSFQLFRVVIKKESLNNSTVITLLIMLMLWQISILLLY